MPQPPPGPIELPRTGIRIEGDVLVKSTRTGEVVGRHSLEDIRHVEARSEWDPPGVVLIFVGLAAAAASMVLIESAVVRWIAFGACMLVGAFGLVACKKTLVLIRSRHGEVRHQNLDTNEDCQGFVVTLRSMIGGGEKGSGSSA